MIKIVRKKIYDESLIRSLSSVIRLRTSLENSLALISLRNQINAAKTLFDDVLYNQIPAYGGEIRGKEQKKHHFPKDKNKDRDGTPEEDFELELDSFLEVDQEFDFNKITLEVDKVSDIDKAVLSDLVDFREVSALKKIG